MDLGGHHVVGPGPRWWLDDPEGFVKRREITARAGKALSKAGAKKNGARYAAMKLPPPLTPSYMDYSGEPNSDLDRPFTLRELEAALVGNAKRSAPGEDAITYTALRNLPDNAKEFLLQIFNQAWHSGSLPSSWTSSLITMIPKPGKPPSIANLRPISLTSCVGKTLERTALTRISEFLEKRDFFPDSLIGFRRRVGAQDMFLLLQHTFLSSTTTQIHALSYQAAIEQAKKLFDLGTRLGIQMSVLDIGGGILGSTRKMDLFAEVCEGVRSALETHFPPSSGTMVIAEPGEFFATSPCTLVVKVVAKRSRLASIDGTVREHHDIYVNESRENCIPRRMYKILDIVPSPLTVRERFP
ncbi:hypothetical protein HPB48_009563 [Haemaphysalis longicornis]|uniref:Orn/DAP/Arg decarboxylase 2 N-terminal domain-containing protein n=1 Tax=Haemaphysalis longicornis TaxID=44386 RepID=A0A9J6FPV7_HAELO|nr:hypothetical protein HPB48_009563 [Haemaphysalis longicornis]